MNNDLHGPTPLRPTARALGVPVQWLRDEAQAGRVPSLLVRRRRLFNVEAVRAALLRRAAEPPAATSGGAS